MVRDRAAEAGILSRGDERRPDASKCDLVLAERARHGDSAAFDELYLLHRDRVYTLCLNLCGDGEQAADLLQETFVKAWRGVRGFRSKSSFATWLYRIAVNVCHDASRTKDRQAKEPLNSNVPDLEIVNQVRDALLKLKSPYRTALVLRYTFSLSYEEIAKMLGWSLPKVRVTIHRAKAAFKDVYVEGNER